MTDRELLELAAKASGILTPSWYGNEAYIEGMMSRWNPLTDDGDALRLAVRLGFMVEPGRCWCSHYGPAFGEDLLVGEMKATRRAIVRAAAAIGEGMP